MSFDHNSPFFTVRITEEEKTSLFSFPHECLFCLGRPGENMEPFDFGEAEANLKKEVL